MQAKDFYLEFLERLRGEYVADRVKDGIFGAMMDVSLVNDVSPAVMPVAPFTVFRLQPPQVTSWRER